MNAFLIGDLWTSETFGGQFSETFAALARSDKKLFLDLFVDNKASFEVLMEIMRLFLKNAKVNNFIISSSLNETKISES